MDTKKEATTKAARENDANIVNSVVNTNENTDNIPLLEKIRKDAENDEQEKKKLPILDIWSDDGDDEVKFLFKRGDLGVIAESNFHLIKGKRGSCKTFLGMDLALAAQGKSTLFALNGDTPLSVLVCDTEQDKSTLKERYRTALTSRGLYLDENIRVLYLRPYEAAERREYVFNEIESFSPKLVIIDTITKLMDVGMNDKNDTAREFIEVFGRLASNRKCAIVGVIHTNKNKLDDNAAGHVGTVGEQEAAEVYLMEQGQPIKNDKRRWGYELKDIQFTFGNDWTITGDINLIDDAKKRELHKIAHSCFEEGKEYRAKEAKERICKFIGVSGRKASYTLKEMVAFDLLTQRKVSHCESYYSLHTESKKTP